MKSKLEMEKLQTKVKLARTIINILTLFTYIGIALCCIVIVSAAFKPSFLYNVSMVPYEVIISSPLGIEGFSRWFAATNMTTYILYGIFIILIFKPLSKILHTIINNTPFDDKNFSYMSFIGWVMIINGILIPVFQYVISTVILRAVLKVSIFVKISWFVVFAICFVGCLILIFAEIFKYGSYLQEEYDSTL